MSDGKNVIIFGVDSSSSVDASNIKKDISVLGKGLIDGLDDPTLTAEVKYSINCSKQQEKFCLKLHYNGTNCFLFVIIVKIY